MVLYVDYGHVIQNLNPIQVYGELLAESIISKNVRNLMATTNSL